MDLWRYLSSITPSPLQPPSPPPDALQGVNQILPPSGKWIQGSPQLSSPSFPSPGPHRSILSREVIALGFPSSSRFYLSQLASLSWLQTGLLELCQQFGRSEKWRTKSAHWLLWWSSKEVTPGGGELKPCTSFLPQVDTPRFLRAHVRRPILVVDHVVVIIFTLPIHCIVNRTIKEGCLLWTNLPIVTRLVFVASGIPSDKSRCFLLPSSLESPFKNDLSFVGIENALSLRSTLLST